MFTAIRPRKSPLYDLAAFEAAMQTALESTAKDVIADYQKTTKTWVHQPEFTILNSSFRVGSRVVSVDIGTEDEIYGYVDNGTKPHIIRPVRAKVLAFNAGSQPKTRPNRLIATAGSPGTQPVKTMIVHHPGSKPRNFSKMIAKKHQQKNTLGVALQKAWTKLANEAGG